MNSTASRIASTAVSRRTGRAGGGNHASKIGRRLVGIGVSLGMSLATPAFAATFVNSPDWPNYLLVASLAALALGLTARALEGRSGPRHGDLAATPPDSIDIYRNSALKP